MKEITISEGMEFKLIKKENITMGGEPARYVEYTTHNQCGEAIQGLYETLHKGISYGFAFTLEPSDNWEKYKPLMDEMATSFKFIEAEK
jgi:hypothetical protein